MGRRLLATLAEGDTGLYLHRPDGSARPLHPMAKRCLLTPSRSRRAPRAGASCCRPTRASVGAAPVRSAEMTEQLVCVGYPEPEYDAYGVKVRTAIETCGHTDEGCAIVVYMCGNYFCACCRWSALSCPHSECAEHEPHGFCRDPRCCQRPSQQEACLSGKRWRGDAP